MAKAKKIDFEASLQQLEQLVEQMEEGELSLEGSLNAFENGVKLTRDCQQALLEAEQKVELLMEKNGELVSEPFHEEHEDGSTGSDQ
jgi:exodeoxyribonuclease VII small subunit